MSSMHVAPHDRGLRQDRRALGLAFACALRPECDPDASAERIAAIASDEAIAIALAKVRRGQSPRASDVARRAERSLQLALEHHLADAS